MGDGSETGLFASIKVYSGSQRVEREEVLLLSSIRTNMSSARVLVPSISEA